MLTRRSLLAASLLGPALPTWCAQAAANDLPAGTITIVVSFPAGGSTDVVMRAVAAKLQPRLSRAVVVENRVGAGGALATGYVAKPIRTG